MNSFSVEIQTSKPPDRVRTEALISLIEPLGRYGYVPYDGERVGPDVCSSVPAVVGLVLVAVLFPFGLLFLFVTDTATVTVILEPENSGTLVRVAGVGEPKVSQAFESMEL